MIGRRLSTVAVVLALLAAGCGGEVDVGTFPTLGPGANIGFMGVLRADDTLLQPASYDEMGRPVYLRQSGFGFQLVIEAKPGTNHADVGRSAFNYDPMNPAARPDLQIEVSRDLGDGSAEVCDNATGNFGGVPGFDPPNFDETQEVSDALNDFGCRFNDGSGPGNPGARDLSSACILFPDGNSGFVDSMTQAQFCATIISPTKFPQGDTIVTARARDKSGRVGPERQIVIRVTGF